MFSGSDVELCLTYKYISQRNNLPNDFGVNKRIF